MLPERYRGPDKALALVRDHPARIEVVERVVPVKEARGLKLALSKLERLVGELPEPVVEE